MAAVAPPKATADTSETSSSTDTWGGHRCPPQVLLGYNRIVVVFRSYCGTALLPLAFMPL